MQSQYDFRYSRALKKVYGGFQVCETPFIPLRRCYFAYCVYPHPAICFREEQDVLFHRPDVEKVFRKFLGHDWKTSDSRHHFFTRLRLPVLMKPGYPALELRWHVLRDSCSFDPEILWQNYRAGAGDPLLPLPAPRSVLSADCLQYVFRPLAVRLPLSSGSCISPKEVPSGYGAD